MYDGNGGRAALMEKISLSAAWAFAMLAGLSAVVVSPIAIIAELGIWGTLVAGSALTVSAFVAAMGVATAHYRWEWVASWVAAASLAPYLVTVWGLTFTDAWTRSTQALLVTSLVGFFVTRALRNAAHAAKLREAHSTATAAIDSVTDGGDGNADGNSGG